MASRIDSLDLNKIGNEDRYRILEYVVDRFGKEGFRKLWVLAELRCEGF